QPVIRAFPSLPPAPDSVEDLGVPETFVEDLLLKTLYRTQVPTPIGLSNQLRVPPGIVREVLEGLKRQRLVETTSASGRFESDWAYRLTEMGMAAADAAFGRSKYVGPIPVPVSEYFRVLDEDS